MTKYFEDINVKAKGIGAFYPESTFPVIGVNHDVSSPIWTDSVGNLVVRGAALTDEGSFRDSFKGTSISTQLSGTLTFTQNSTTVVGVGTSFLSSNITLLVSTYIKIDNTTNWYVISNIIDDTHLELLEPFTQETVSGVNASIAKYVTSIGTGGNISVADSICSVSSGTNIGQKTYIIKELDYGPLILSTFISISQRIANQIGIVGLLTQPEGSSLPENSAWFEFSGTDNTKVLCKSTLDNENESIEVTIPSSNVTSNQLNYRIEVCQEYVQFKIEDTVVATHKNKIPDPYASLNLFCGWINNGTPSSTSTIGIDTIFVNNSNMMQVQGGYSGLPLRVVPDPTSIKDGQNGREVQLATNRELRTTESVRICGGGFEGTTIDTNIWTVSAANGASNSISGIEAIIASGTTNGALAVFRTKSIARIRSGYQNVLGMAMRFSTGVTGNKRKVGMLDENRQNGFFFYLYDSTFGVGCIKGGVETLVPSGNFNGNIGSSYTLDTNYHTFEIFYGLTSIEFYIDGKLLQRIRGTSAPLVDSMLLYITVENSNTTSTSGSASVYSAMMVVQALTAFNTQPLTANIESNGTYTLKLSGGTLRCIINMDNVGTCYVYDNTSAANPKLAPQIDCTRVLGAIQFGRDGINFNKGLTVVTAGGAKLLVIYE